MKKNIYVIGFGASAIGFLQKAIKDSLLDEYDITVFDRGTDIGKCSFGGMKYDGKLISSEEVGGEWFSLESQDKAVEYIKSKITIPDAIISTGESFHSVDDNYKKFYYAGFKLHSAKYTHCGTDLLENAVSNIYNEFVKSGIQFKFGYTFETIHKSRTNGNTNMLFSVCDDTDITTESIELFPTDIVVMAVGRSGVSTIKDCNTLSKYIMSSSYVDLGIRFEFPHFVTEELDKVMYEIKCSLDTSNGLVARLFCQNPRGFVTTEKYINKNETLYSVNGHAISDNKSSNTNLAILVRHSFTEPFNDSVAFGSAIARLANMLGGGDKVILQTYGDLKRGKRTKKIGRVHPTLDRKMYILGDLNYALPAKTRESIIEFIEKFSEIVPGFNSPDNLCYGIEVKFYSNKMRNTEQVCFIGDCSGKTSSIIKAFCHGEILAERIAGGWIDE